MSSTKDKKKKKKAFSTLGSLLSSTSMQSFDDAQLGLFPDSPVTFKKGYVTQEYQSYGLFLAQQLHDMKRVKMYIKLAKTVNRGALEHALSFVSDAENARSKARLFLWKLKQIRLEKEEKNKKSDPEKSE